MVRQKLRALGAHVYAGGFTLGIGEHFECGVHFEDGPFGVETSEKNLGVIVHQKPWPVESFTQDQYPIDLVYCNPPCAPWSQASSGRANSWDADPRLSCQHECFDLLRKLEPGVWMLESVRGLYNKGKSLVMEFVMEAQTMGYCAYFVLTDGPEHGLPQSRRRFFLVFSQYEISWQPTKSPSAMVGDVLGSLYKDPDPSQTAIPSHLNWGKIVDKVAPGEYVRKAFDREYPELIGHPRCGRGSFLLRRADPDAVCQTFTGDCKTLHPEEDRFLSVGEAAALSGFPKGYRFYGTTGKRYNQIARGVLPPVAEYMGDMARRAIERAWEPATLDPREVHVYRDDIEVYNV